MGKMILLSYSIAALVLACARPSGDLQNGALRVLLIHDDVPIHNRPGPGGAVIARLKFGTVLPVYGTVRNERAGCPGGEWFRVKRDAADGYVCGSRCTADFVERDGEIIGFEGEADLADGGRTVLSRNIMIYRPRTGSLRRIRVTGAINHLTLSFSKSLKYMMVEYGWIGNRFILLYDTLSGKLVLRDRYVEYDIPPAWDGNTLRYRAVIRTDEKRCMRYWAARLFSEGKVALSGESGRERIYCGEDDPADPVSR